MPDGGYTGSVEDFTKAHTDVVGVKEEVEATLKIVWDQVAACQTFWTGNAATAFQNLMTRFDGDAKKLNTALEDIATQLQGAGSTYSEKEESQSDVFGGLSAKLDG